MSGSTRCVFAQDHLVQRGGAERALLSMLKAAPGAPVVTSFYDPDRCYPEFLALDVRASPLNRVAALRRRHRSLLPLMPLIMSSIRVDADVVLCGTSGWAQGIRSDGRKVLYFYALTRWLYEREAYLKGSGPLPRLASTALAPALALWDRRTVRSGDRFVTEGTVMQRRLREIYSIDAEIVPLPNTLDPSATRAPVPGLDAGFFLSAGRLVPYKNVDVLVEAFARLPAERLVVAGGGPLLERLRARATPNVTFLGECADDTLRWLYASCRAVITVAVEPFGLTPVEGASFGKPTIALAEGGFVDTVLDGSTGVHVPAAEPAAVVAGVERFLASTFDTAAITLHAGQYSEDRFVARTRALLEGASLDP